MFMCMFVWFITVLVKQDCNPPLLFSCGSYEGLPLFLGGSRSEKRNLQIDWRRCACSTTTSCQWYFLVEKKTCVDDRMIAHAGTVRIPQRITVSFIGSPFGYSTLISFKDSLLYVNFDYLINIFGFVYPCEWDCCAIYGIFWQKH